MEQTIDRLHALFLRLLKSLPSGMERSLMQEINWNSRLIGIRGARGVGKTTLMLQHIRREFSGKLNKVLYVSLDSIWFSGNSILELADTFSRQGGEYLFLDEVHKYPEWSVELKNMYDAYPDLKVVFTGSSLLDILNSSADLSRRAVSYNLQGLSFREYLALQTGAILPQLTLSEILHHNEAIFSNWSDSIKPFVWFRAYLKTGYYPFFQEQPDTYYQKIREITNMILEIELPLLRKVEVSYVYRIRQLLNIISQSVPFVPNISALSSKMGIERSTLLAYLHYLDEVKLCLNLYKEAGGVSKLQKPQKIYLENPNLFYALYGDTGNIGAIRETFFANQVSYRHRIQYSEKGDFRVDDQFTFEIGGANKTRRQIHDVSESRVVADDIEWGRNHKIPLWMFGCLY
jgi:predicted AAA+ superfamily ATPase